MEQLHRNLKRWEDQERIKTHRLVYSGKDDLTGEYYDQVFPINDLMCSNCAKKYKDKDFIKKAQIIFKASLCRFCGTYYQIPSNFSRIHIYAGRNTLKRYSRLDQYYNTNKDRELANNKTERKIKELAHKLQ